MFEMLMFKVSKLFSIHNLSNNKFKGLPSRCFLISDMILFTALNVVLNKSLVS